MIKRSFAVAARLFGAVALTALGLTLAGCGSSSAATSSTSTTTSTTTSPSSVISTETTKSTETTETTTGSSSALTPPTSQPSTCAQLATRTFLKLTVVTAQADHSLQFIGQPATLVCGGPDDSHYNVDTTRTTSGRLLPTGVVQVFPVSLGAEKTILNAQLASYLTTDTDSGIFLVTGPLAAATELQEQFHP